jgi:uncharacterized protein (TIGR02594 family)
MTLPTKYSWLTKEGAPKMLVEALKLYGTLESAGTANNPTIVKWAEELGEDVEDVYKADSIPWCGLFVGVVAKRAGKEVVKSPLWALSWATFGTYSPTPMLGDVLVFTRTGGGHVGLYCFETKTHYGVLGGNQSDSVSIALIDKKRLYTARRPEYSISQPRNVRQIIISDDGNISTNEQ